MARSLSTVRGLDHPIHSSARRLSQQMTARSWNAAECRQRRRMQVNGTHRLPRSKRIRSRKQWRALGAIEVSTATRQGSQERPHQLLLHRLLSHGGRMRDGTTAATIRAHQHPTMMTTKVLQMRMSMLDPTVLTGRRQQLGRTSPDTASATSLVMAVW